MTRDDGIAVPLRAALDELERRLRDFGAPVVEHLLPGRAATEVGEVLGRYGLEAPAELTTLWGWHDGTASERYEDTRLVGHWHVMSLEQAADTHALHREIYDDPRSDPAGYPQGWFPTLLYWDGPFAAVDCRGRVPGERPLYVVDPQSDLPADPPTPQFASVRDLVETLVRFFDLGVVVRDDHGGASVPWERVPDELRAVGYW